MNESVFLDTSGLLCVHDMADWRHSKAAELYRNAEQMLVTNYVFAEFVPLEQLSLAEATLSRASLTKALQAVAPAPVIIVTSRGAVITGGVVSWTMTLGHADHDQALIIT